MEGQVESLTIKASKRERARRDTAQEFPLYPKMHGPEMLRNYWGYGSERVIQGHQTNETPQYEAIRG